MNDRRVAPTDPQAQLAAPLSDAARHVLLITGMSGAGKTTALKSLEDLGFECIDHLPLRLLPRLLRPDAAGESWPLLQSLAVGIDVRTRDFAVESVTGIIDRLRQENVALKLVFLYCDDEEVRRRYSATRHRHPLADRLPLVDGITRERQFLLPLRERADLAIDTTGLNPGQLKRILEGHFAPTAETSLTVQVISFSFRSGLPRDADLVFDVRFLSNPFYRPELRAQTGFDEGVAGFIRADPAHAPFSESLRRLLQPLLPRYVAEGKSYLTIAVGCTGGRHRSVLVAEELATWLQGQGQRVHVLHRDLDRSSRRSPDPETKAS